MRVTISRKAHFNAAHRLHNAHWSEEQNTKIFGKCNNPHYHGHNYDLVVSVTGDIDPDTGYVMDAKILKDLIKAEVEEALDHKNLNLDVDFMKGKMTSTEVLAIAIWEELDEGIAKLGAILHSIKVQETENNFVEYFGQ